MRRFAALCSLFFLFLVGCAGSTSFLGEGFPEMILLPGGQDTLVMELEAEGSHAGEHELVARVNSGSGLTATIDPTSADVDGILEVVVTVSAADDATPGTGSVQVEAIRKGEVRSSRAIRVEIVDPNENSSTEM